MGKGNKQVLNNNDEVALALKKNKGKVMISELKLLQNIINHSYRNIKQGSLCLKIKARKVN